MQCKLFSGLESEQVEEDINQWLEVTIRLFLHNTLSLSGSCPPDRKLDVLGLQMSPGLADTVV